ncbi:hypothetical protein KUTeg_020037 [Tegillarca granosa]|uniref:High-affinity choline transporter 1 n=1 Tax=Tegillarca granosa TaxID=220873 RepID=A0ABQ9EIE7_TEGGR|nr:hypothetical protein KUTeg_020037 [Tegillarca granosa]
MAVNIPGLIGMLAFYLLIMIVGFVAAAKKKKSSNNSEDLLLAGRNLNLFVATTMVGGGFINGTAEAMGRDGLIWSIAPITYNFGVAMGTYTCRLYLEHRYREEKVTFYLNFWLSVAAIFYAPRVRKANYHTIFDPMQEKYGQRWGAFLFFAEFLSDLFWEAAILSALGTTLAIILDIETSVAIIVSAVVAVVYTIFGGLFAVAYTDVIQLFCIAFGIILCIPFAARNPNVDFSRIKDTWLGHVDDTGPSHYHVGIFVDFLVMTTFGGIPWQAFYQRMLACRSPSMARTSTLIGVGISISMVIPPAIIGAIGASTDWNGTDYYSNLNRLVTNGTVLNMNGTQQPEPFSNWVQILPLVMHHLCPPAVSIIGIGAISAAVMSSADSICLAIGSIFSKNIYKNVIRPKHLCYDTRTLGTIIAISADSVYGLFILCGDLMYIIQFPQLTCALWVKFSNTYGSIVGTIIGLFLRLIAGEPILKIPAAVRYPLYDELNMLQAFPYKTLSMVGCYFGILVFSYITDYLFRNEIISREYDYLNCFENLEKTKASKLTPVNEITHGKGNEKYILVEQNGMDFTIDTKEKNENDDKETEKES